MYNNYIKEEAELIFANSLNLSRKDVAVMSNNTTSSIITIGRKYGNGSTAIFHNALNMAAPEDRSARKLLNILESNAMIKSCWSTQPMTVGSARSCLSIMMRSQQTVFFILL